MTREEILAIRAMGSALVAQCDASLMRMWPHVLSGPAACACYICASGERCSKAAAVVAAQIVVTDDAACRHARVVRTGVMGAPLRARCLDCGGAIEALAEPSGVPA